MKPRWEIIEKENPWLETEYYDIDENKDLVAKYSMSDYPCFIFLDKQGKEITRLYGELPKKKIIEKINELKDK
jgi:thioredoxin-related protein